MEKKNYAWISKTFYQEKLNIFYHSLKSPHLKQKKGIGFRRATTLASLLVLPLISRQHLLGARVSLLVYVWLPSGRCSLGFLSVGVGGKYLFLLAFECGECLLRAKAGGVAVLPGG